VVQEAVQQQDIDWPALRLAAVEVMHRAYAPYSNFPVGAAALVDDGRVVVGCNVENAAYGVVLCAECGVVSQLHSSGGGRLIALACVDASGGPLMPCGRCRQLLWENGGPNCLIDHASGPLTMSQLLPHAFGPDDLDRVREQELPGSESSDVAGRGISEFSDVAGRDIWRRQWQGLGSVVVHLDSVAGQPVWTAYWDRSTGAADDQERGILEEGPNWSDRADAVAWGRARTPRVFVVDADGTLRDPDGAEVAR
jgi:cytidine deaminase